MMLQTKTIDSEVRSKVAEEVERLTYQFSKIELESKTILNLRISELEQKLHDKEREFESYGLRAEALIAQNKPAREIPSVAHSNGSNGTIRDLIVVIYRANYDILDEVVT